MANFRAKVVWRYAATPHNLHDAQNLRDRNGKRTVVDVFRHSVVRWHSRSSVSCLWGRARNPVMRSRSELRARFPATLPPGQTTVIHVAISSRDAIQAAEISPAQGLKVSRIQQRETTQGVLTWSELTIEAALDAAPGTRTLVLVLPPPTGRTAPLPLTVPTHAPSVADLRVLSASSTPSTLELQLAASDASGDLGDLPYVWFSLGCGSEPLVGVVRGRVTPQSAGNSPRPGEPPRPARASHREMRSAGEAHRLRGYREQHVEDIRHVHALNGRGAEPL